MLVNFLRKGLERQRGLRVNLADRFDYVGTQSAVTLKLRFAKPLVGDRLLRKALAALPVIDYVARLSSDKRRLDEDQDPVVVIIIATVSVIDTGITNLANRAVLALEVLRWYSNSHFRNLDRHSEIDADLSNRHCE